MEAQRDFPSGFKIPDDRDLPAQVQPDDRDGRILKRGSGDGLARDEDGENTSRPRKGEEAAPWVAGFGHHRPSLRETSAGRVP